MPTSPIPAVEAIQHSVSVKKDRPKSKLYETLQKVRRNTFTSGKEEEEGKVVKSPPSSAGPNPKGKPTKVASKGSVNGNLVPEKSSVPVIVVNSPAQILNTIGSENELSQMGRTKSMDSINDQQEMSTHISRKSNLQYASDMDTIEPLGTPVLRESTKTNFTSRFPEIDDVLLQYHSCAWERDILWQGRLYITKTCICFYAKIFGNEVKLLLKFKEITSIEKSVVVGLIPNSITIFSKGQRYFFASFMKRDTTFEYLYCLWTNCKDCDGGELRPEMRVVTAFDTPTSMDSSNTSALNSQLQGSLPLLPSLPRKQSKLATVARVEEPIIEVNSNLSIKGAVLAVISAFILAVVIKYTIWNRSGHSPINVRDALEFKEQLHLHKVKQITGSMVKKNHLIQGKLSDLVGLPVENLDDKIAVDGPGEKKIKL